MRQFVKFALGLFLLSAILGYGLFVIALARLKISNDSLNDSPISAVGGGSASSMYATAVWASKRCPKRAEIITLRAIITNTGTVPLVEELANEPVFDLELNTVNHLVRWSDGRPLTSELTRLELDPGEAKAIELRAAVLDNPTWARADLKPQRTLSEWGSPTVAVEVEPCYRGW